MFHCINYNTTMTESRPFCFIFRWWSKGVPLYNTTMRESRPFCFIFKVEVRGSTVQFASFSGWQSEGLHCIRCIIFRVAVRGVPLYTLHQFQGGSQRGSTVYFASISGWHSEGFHCILCIIFRVVVKEGSCCIISQ